MVLVPFVTPVQKTIDTQATSVTVHAVPTVDNQMRRIPRPATHLGRSPTPKVFQETGDRNFPPGEDEIRGALSACGEIPVELLLELPSIQLTLRSQHPQSYRTFQCDGLSLNLGKSVGIAIKFRSISLAHIFLVSHFRACIV
jgi:hypothetical protein